MPEGPEIRRAADQHDRALRGQQALAVEFHTGPLRRHGPRLTGQRIESVTPRSKAMLIRFAGGATLYSHNQLYGRWCVLRAGAARPAGLALRVLIRTRTHTALLYSATDIELLDDAGVAAHPYLARLGVELLDPATTREAVRAQAHAAAFQRRSLASLLLDQGFYAGLGNYLRSEILYVARLRHDARLGSLDDSARVRLADAALDLTRQAYRTRGVTNELERVARLKREGLSFARYRHHVFDRAGHACWECGTLIVRTDVSGRGVYFCPACQGGSASPRLAGQRARTARRY